MTQEDNQLPVLIPYERISEDVLDALIEEFVTRDGTDITDAFDKSKQVKRQLKSGRIVITFDPETETCAIVLADQIS